MIRSIYDAVASSDPASWVGHLLICTTVLTVSSVLWGPLAAVGATGLTRTFYAYREGLNWGEARMTGRADKDKLRDGILDYAGPELAHWAAWALLLSG